MCDLLEKEKRLNEANDEQIAAYKELSRTQEIHINTTKKLQEEYVERTDKIIIKQSDLIKRLHLALYRIMRISDD